MDNSLIDINKIIAQILSGEAGLDDILVFNSWLNQKEENKIEFLLLKSYWEAESGLPGMTSPEIAFERFSRRLQSASQKEQKIQKPWIYVWSVAANILLVLGFSFFLLMKFNHTPTQYHTYHSGDSGTTEIGLPDGTQVTLNKNSNLTYSDSYGKENRCVKLEGEAYFNVTKNPEKVFKVTMGNSTIEVLGTIFNVQAYTGKPEIVATLEEGSIKFRAENQQIVLAPNQQLIYHRQTGKLDVLKAEPDVVSAWKDQLYRYHSITIHDLSKELEKIYGVEIVLPDRLGNIKVSGSFVYGQPIEEVLGVIQKRLPFNWEKQNQKIVIR